MGAVRELADRYTEAYFGLDPVAATFVGARGHDDALTDYSPEGWAARAELARRTLAELEGVLAGGEPDELDRRCAILLRERLDAYLALHDHDDERRHLANIGSPAQDLREVFDVMPRATAEDWEQIGKRLLAVPPAYEQYRSSLAAAATDGQCSAPRQVETVAEQLAVWAGQRDTPAYFAKLAAKAPDGERGRLDEAAWAATEALEGFRRYLLEEYAPAAAGTPDAFGSERYARAVRLFNGTDLDLGEAYEYGWEEFNRIDAEMRAEADRVLPGATPLEAMAHLDDHGPAIEGEAVLREWLQGITALAIDALDGTHFDLDGPLRVVEAQIAPPGGPGAPYYTAPTEDFSRPGRTWFPTMGRTRFPTWEHVSTWYHEAVPGHHLQLAQWLVVAPELSRFQSSLGWVSANCEGWALYAERFMDELGFFTDPGRRLGFLVAQQLRAIRVVIDIGMHLELEIPTGQAFHPGERWTPELGREFLLAYGGTDTKLLESEIVRYLGMAGQAIGYKLGERVWLEGRAEAKRRRGADFDLKAWHMAALSQGSLGLDDLAVELAAL
jgi:uncharacterized protein (DUF885 family)